VVAAGADSENGVMGIPVTTIAKEASMSGIWVAIALATVSLLVVAPMLTGRRTAKRGAPEIYAPTHDWIRGP
jgi:hypothetical protein